MTDNLYEMLKLSGNFTQFLTLIDMGEYSSAFHSFDEFTVFAPNDEAFDKTNPQFLDALYKNRSNLDKIFDTHIIPGKLLMRQIENMPYISTKNERSIKISFHEKDIYIQKAKVIRADIEAVNGIIHEIDQFIII